MSSVLRRRSVTPEPIRNGQVRLSVLCLPGLFFRPAVESIDVVFQASVELRFQFGVFLAGQFHMAKLAICV